ncbi:copper amine oxidase [Flagelloscypha sp. PMI_526]|nr:copper amine oxidase [Flagelloscypha sp. PMI_526]
MATSEIPGTVTSVQSKAVLAPEPSHPLDPLTPDEIIAISHSIKTYLVVNTEIKAVKFITSWLLPPPKRAVLAALGIPVEVGKTPEAPVEIVRKAECDFIDVVNGRCYNVILASKESDWAVETFTALAEGVNPQISVEELIEAENVVKKDPKVIEIAKELGIEPDQIYCDGWSIGYDERFPKTRRVQQGFCFARFSKHDNLYAHPLDFIPVVDVTNAEVLHIDWAPHYKFTPNGPQLSAGGSTPASLETRITDLNRGRIPVPRKPFDILPDLMEQTQEGFKMRDDLKPLHVLQPEGVSFSMKGNELEWQKWKMHVSFSHREGIVLSTVTYNDGGLVRPVFYRMNLAEMVVPYAAPEWPHSRKFAFDVGEYGMGTMANELSLGCDCLGQIHYLPGAFVKNNGGAFLIKNAICIHEEDAGILHKHTDFRPGGRSHAARRRRLAIQMTCTLANYEYILTYYFYQDGNVEFDIKLTGILQVYVKAEGEPTPYGTEVAPGINAHYHQHLFSLRVDPMIDGLANSLVETDVVPVPDLPGSEANFAGNGFRVEENVLANATSRSYDPLQERRWRIVNSSRKHYSTGQPVGYQFNIKGGATPLMARPGSWVDKRAPWASKPLWVCQAGEDRLFPSGKFVPQTRDAPEDSVSNWVAGRDSVENEDILLFLTFGTTHIPRPEDWPVMPVEELSILFKPVGFFAMNPSMDVPAANDHKSVSAFSSDGSASCCS